VLRPPLSRQAGARACAKRSSASHERFAIDAPTTRRDRASLYARRDLGHRLAPGFAVRIAVNHELARDDAPVSPGDEVAFFPPVTGG
jgi:molybdopterin synthase sulfur carrier subunit